MSRKWLKTTLIFLTAATMGAALAACASQSETKYDYTVTFDYNEPYSLSSVKVVYACGVCDFVYDETVGDSRSNIAAGTKWEDVSSNFVCPSCHITAKADFVKEKSGREPEYFGISAEDPHIYIKPGDLGTGLEKFTEYYVKGWHLPKLDEEGNVVVQEDGTVALDREWNFKEDVVEGDMTLYADLTLKPRIIIMDGDTVAHTIPCDFGVPEARPLEGNYPKVTGKTFYNEYYEDPEFTKVFEGWPYLCEEGVDLTLYCRFLPGIWDFVSTAAEFSRSLTKQYTSIWLEKDIEFDANTEYPTNSNFYAELDGRGHKISGINVTVTGRGNVSGELGVLFGALGANTYIHDVTFDNVQAEFTTAVDRALPFDVSMFASSAAEGCKIENVTVTGSIVQGAVTKLPIINYYQTIQPQRDKSEQVDFKFSEVKVPANKLSEGD